MRFEESTSHNRVKPNHYAYELQMHWAFSFLKKDSALKLSTVAIDAAIIEGICGENCIFLHNWLMFSLSGIKNIDKEESNCPAFPLASQEEGEIGFWT